MTIPALLFKLSWMDDTILLMKKSNLRITSGAHGLSP
jgi:hypothetical protein